MKDRVVVAMSGGVDSSVAAYLLVREGYEVIGVTMDLIESSCRIKRPDTCCSLAAFEDAMKVAEIIGISHRILNLKKEFEQKVIGPFLEEYLTGRTPNPCVVCNKEIKFGLLLNYAKELGADLLATGHYARIERTDSGYQLKKAVDLSRDQSYFLYCLTPKQLSSALMPLGSYTKQEVRQIARELKLPVATKPESREICFVPDNNYKRFLAGRVSDRLRPGPILDKKGNILGCHQGISSYTIGQRKGLGLALGKPQYVTEIDKDKNILIVGDKKDLSQSELIAEDVNWISSKEPTSDIQASAKIRYLHQEAPAIITPLSDGNVQVKFEKPQQAITPGQAVVFYQDDVVLGGGWIKKN